MKIQDRDLEIIKFIMENQGATIEHIAKLFFKGNYNAAGKRLQKLKDTKYIKAGYQPILNKLVYHHDKMPSYHNLIINDVIIALGDRIMEFKRDIELGKYKVDAMTLIDKDNPKLLIFEIDIFNKTNNDKINAIKQYCNNELNSSCKVIVISKIKASNSNADLNIYIGKEEGVYNIYRVLESLQ